MTTTREALLTRQGVRLGYVLVIDGYSRLLTTAADTSKAVDAWAGTDWTEALPGLEVQGNFEQRFRPFSNELDIPTLSFSVLDPSDQFGRDMFTSQPSIRSRLYETFETGGTEIKVKRPGGFDPGGGVVYIGCKAYSYSAVTATGLTVDTAGIYSPFTTSGGSQVPGKHTVPKHDQIGRDQVATPPQVNFRTPSTWIGREVGLFLHLIEGETWNTRAEALCVFAGEIEALEEGSGGQVILHCADIRKRIADTTLMRDQWTAQLVAGYSFTEGDSLDLRVLDTTTAASVVGASALECVSGASGSGEFEPGTYTAEEMASLVEDWLNSDASVGSWSWSCQVASTGYGLRFRLTVDFGADRAGGFYLAASDRDILDFLGWPDGQQAEDRIEVFTRLQDGSAWTLTAPESPMTVMPFRTKFLIFRSVAPTLKLAHASGTFHDLTDDLPEDAQQHVSDATATDRWSFFSIGDELLILGRLSSDESQIEHVAMSVALSKVTERTSDLGLKGTRSDDGAVIVKQVAVLSGTLTDVLTKLLASIDGNGVNHATYDTLPWGAAIPWELLGDNWLDSVANLEQSSTSDALTVIIEKPTRLWDVIGPDIVLRSAFVRWKDAGLQLGVFQVPNAANADWQLDEDNKAGKPGDNLRTSPAEARDFLVNNIKIEFNRHPLQDEYQDIWPLMDTGSIEAYGERAITVKARNSYKAVAGNGDAVEALAETMVSRMLPLFANPMRTWRRTMSHQQFLMAPGDTVSFADDWVRDPTTGRHGTTTRGGTALFTSWSLGIGGGSYNGQVDVLYSDEDRFFPMPPCAEHDPAGGGTSGWDSATKRLYVLAHAFSRAGDDTDASRFVASDVVRVYEIDPADPAVVDSFTDTIAAVNDSYLTLTDGFGGANPAFDSSKVYRVDYADFASLTSDQQIAAYQCGDDGQVASLTDPMLWGEESIVSGFTAADITEPPVLHGDGQLGDGAPMSPALIQDQARILNHLIHYRTAINSPILPKVVNEITADDPGVTWKRLWTFPLYVGGGRFLGGRERKIRVRAQFRSQVAATEVSVRITSSGQPPIGGSDDDVNFRGATQQVSWSTSDDTQWPVSDRAELRLVRDPRRPHLTYITVEGSYQVGFLGLPELRLLPAS